MEKGITVEHLLSSNIFSFDFDYDEWPGSHNNDGLYRRPYNKSIFDLRHNYKEVFPEANLDDILDENGMMKDKSITKVVKIKYTLNMLPEIGTYISGKNPDGTRIVENTGFYDNFMMILSLTEELPIFNTQSMNDLIEFKWDQYGMRHHLTGVFMHMI